MKKNTLYVLTGLATALLLAGCATGPSVAELNALTDQIVKSSFRDQDFVKVARITETDETNRACSEADVAGKPLDEKTARAIEAVNLKTVKWPSDGKFIGDWKEGEKIAQSGRGLTWTDDAKMANGGNCYNCHQMDKKNFLRHHRPQPLQLRQDPRCERSSQPGQQSPGRVHMGQDLERQGLQRLLQHAARRPHGHPQRKSGARHRGPAARPEITRQPVMDETRLVRVFLASIYQ